MSYFPYIFSTGQAHAVSDNTTRKRKHPIGFAPPTKEKPMTAYHDRLQADYYNPNKQAAPKDEQQDAPMAQPKPKAKARSKKK